MGEECRKMRVKAALYLLKNLEEQMMSHAKIKKNKKSAHEYA